MKQLRTLVLFLTLLTAVSAWAGPARGRAVSVTQPDGTTLTIRLTGDEHHHFLATTDGLPVTRGADGTYYYTTRTSDGTPAPSTQVAHDAADRTADELAYVAAHAEEFAALRSLGKERAAASNARRAKRLRANGRSLTKANTQATQAATTSLYTGSRKGLVILVNFKDKKLTSTHTQDVFDDLFNLEGYNEGGNNGSVHDYFSAQSYGAFDLTFDVVGPVTVSKNMAYYGQNDANGDDMYPGEMVKEACQLADAEVNFADYDWDGDGEADQVYVIYAGYGEAYDTYGLMPETIWPHEYWLSEMGINLTLDGVKIDTYGCSSELVGYTGTELETIGTPVHEFSHCMGLPDLYDTQYAGGYGLQTWSVMSDGSYNTTNETEGTTPAGYTSYERMVSGWLTPKELTDPTLIEGMKPLAETPEAYIIYNQANKDEYYLLENRQAVGYDAGLFGHGLIVLHVDYDKDVWDSNAVNDDADHQRCSLIAADNSYDMESYSDIAADAYPGTSGNTALTDETKPAATLFNANADGRKYMGRPITEIAESADGLISFNFCNAGVADAPTGLGETDVTATSFTATWDAVEGADTYVAELYAADDQGQQKKDEIRAATVLSEDFQAIFDERTADGTQDISASLDDYTDAEGWTGQKLFAGVNALKMGSAKAIGTLTSPAIAAPASGSLTFLIGAEQWKNDNTAFTLSLTSAASGSVLAQKSLNASAVGPVFTIDGITEDWRLTIATTKRIYLSYIIVLSGSYTQEEIEAAYADDDTPVAVQTLSDLTTPSATFTGLTAGAAYTWRVRATVDGRAGTWSEKRSITLPTAEGIDSAPAAADETVDILTPDGRRVGRTTRSAFLASPIYKGVYLLRGTTTQRVVKVAK